jgi:hypothetical protein
LKTCRRAAFSIVVSGTVLELPPQEYQQLKQLAGDGAGQIVLKLAGRLKLQLEGATGLGMLSDATLLTAVRSNQPVMR